jgi:hypothetical protein
MAAATVLALLWAGPVQAMGGAWPGVGIEGGEIDGEGIGAPIELGTGEFPWNWILTDFGLHPVMYESPPDKGQPLDQLTETAPTADLGPPLTVTWRVQGPARRDAAGGWRSGMKLEIVQDLYLYAAGGPLLHTAAGQQASDDWRTRGGWFAAAPELLTKLQALGVPERSVLTGSPSDPTATTPDATDDSAERWDWMPPAAGVAAVLVVGAGVATVVRRRRLPATS